MVHLILPIQLSIHLPILNWIPSTKTAQKDWNCRAQTSFCTCQVKYKVPNKKPQTYGLQKAAESPYQAPQTHKAGTSFASDLFASLNSNHCFLTTYSSTIRLALTLNATFVCSHIFLTFFLTNYLTSEVYKHLTKQSAALQFITSC